MSSFVPDRGTVVWLDFSPHSGHEQAGRRPALVLSSRAYNQKSGLALMCPITQQEKGYPFEVSLPKEVGIRGVVLCDHVRSVDWQSRNAEFVGNFPDLFFPEVLQRIIALLVE